VIRGEVLDFNKDIQCMDSLILRSITFGFLRAAMADLFEKKEFIPQNFNKKLGGIFLSEVLKEYPGATAGMDISLGE
jgi:hypothetical protein